MEETFPKNKFELKYSNIAPEVIKSLKELKRAGWVKRGVKNPETVYEHTVALRNFVISEMNSLDEFSAQEKEELLDMLEVHDWPESDSKVGDRIVLKTDANIEALKKEKAQLELESMTSICEKLGEKGKKILELWIRFENGQDPVSLFANQLDKYQAMEKALEYEKGGETVSTQGFIDNDAEKITNPFLVAKLQALKEKLAGIKS